MLIKFFRNGKGAGAGPVGYLVADKVLAYDDNRDLIRDADGEPMTVMRVATPEFIRRFLIHVLPDRFHRIRHYGLLASSGRKAHIAKVRILLGAQAPRQDDPPVAEIIPLTLREPCPDCGGALRIIETFRRGQKPQSRAPPREAAA